MVFEPLNEKDCEVLGAFIGDGCNSLFGGRHRRVQFTGDSRHDLSYYQNTIIPYVLQDATIAPPKVRLHKNTLRVSFNSKRLSMQLQEIFGAAPGVKTYTVRIPDSVLALSRGHLFSCVRGIFDTDGCVYIDRRPLYKKGYPRISLQTCSKPLYDQLVKILVPHFSLYKRASKRKPHKAYILEIYGHAQIARWMALIGFSNPRHLKRLSAPFA